MTSNTSPILTAAINYASHGWPVIPLKGKIPIIKDWPKKATTDEATIHKYFPPELLPDPANLRGDYGVMLEVYDFLMAVRDRRRPELDGADGLKAQIIPIAFFESSTCGQAVKVDDVLSGSVDAYQQEINDKWEI